MTGAVTRRALLVLACVLPAVAAALVVWRTVGGRRTRPHGQRGRAHAAYDVINTHANHLGTYEAKDSSLMPGMATNTQLEEPREAKGMDAEILPPDS